MCLAGSFRLDFHWVLPGISSLWAPLWSTSFFCNMEGWRRSTDLTMKLSCSKNRTLQTNGRITKLKWFFSQLNGRSRTQTYPTVLKWLTAVMQAHITSVFLWILRRVEHPEMHSIETKHSIFYIFLKIWGLVWTSSEWRKIIYILCILPYNSSLHFSIPSLTAALIKWGYSAEAYEINMYI